MGSSWVRCLLALAALGCAAAPLTSPLDGGREWRELRSEHFTLQTDTSASNAQTLIEQLETGHFALQRAGFPYVDKVRGTARIVFIEDLPGLESIGHGATDGVAYRPSLFFDDSDLLLLSDPETELDLELVLHELTHRFVNYYYPSAPPWLNEGLAEYFSTMRVEDGEAVLGEYVSGIAFWKRTEWAVTRSGRSLVPISAVPGVKALRAIEPADFYQRWEDSLDANRARTANYAGAWALIHTMTSLPNGWKLLEAYLDEIYRGSLSEQAVWTRTFGRFEADLDGYHRNFLDADELFVFRVPIGQAPKPRFTERMMAPAEVHTLWAMMRLPSTPAARRAIRRDLDRALRADPRYAEAYLRRGLLNAVEKRFAEARRDLDRAAEAAPGNARYVLGQAMLSLANVDAKQAVVRTSELRSWAERVAKSARSAAELTFLADCMRVLGRPGTALRYASSAVRVDGSCFYCWDSMAQAYASLRNWPKAVSAMHLAVNLVPHGFRVRGYAERLEGYERELASTATEPPPDSD